MNAPDPHILRPSVFTDEIVGLSAIYTPGVRVVAWRRALPVALSEAAARLVAEHRTFERACTVRAGEPLAAPLDLPGEANPGRAALLADIQELTQIFADLTGDHVLGLRLRVLEGTMCPKWHVDRLRVRLICTYLGPGTEWLEVVDGVERSPSPRILGLSPELAPDHRLSPGWVGLFKGASASDHGHDAAVHRSPGVPKGGARLILTVEGLG
ncbi:MAG: hypothetical protein RIT28_4827 [Pseudomonadota bacterium]|jgi:hypothetical protein